MTLWKAFILICLLKSRLTGCVSDRWAGRCSAGWLKYAPARWSVSPWPWRQPRTGSYWECTSKWPNWVRFKLRHHLCWMSGFARARFASYTLCKYICGERLWHILKPPSVFSSSSLFLEGLFCHTWLVLTCFFSQRFFGSFFCSSLLLLNETWCN